MLRYSQLSSLQKPTRYIGGEVNAIVKDPDDVAIRCALAFPDVYEIGESNLALKILYNILNKQPHIWAERVYTPWRDAELLMKSQAIPLFTLESGTPLRNFHFLGITLPSELCYTNILTILSLGGIPLHATDRDIHHPVVIGGGPGAANPEPLSEFFDLFVMGDGEEVIIELMNRWLEVKGEVNERGELLDILGKIDGVYAPSHFTPVYKPDGTIQEIRPFNPEKPEVHRRLIKDIDHALYPESQIVPAMEAIHDRIGIEIARGCTRGCRFCQAGMLYRPPRERSLSTIENFACSLVRSTGYEEISLLSLSSGDYSRLEELMSHLRETDYGVKPMVFSFPSLRPDGLPAEVLRRLRETRKTGFTFAPEAGSERLRKVINKGITGSDIFAMTEQVFLAGWDMLKLYFMIGLPTETEGDLLEIVKIVREIKNIGRGILKKTPRFNITLSPFVPKPHTPFQWSAQNEASVLKGKLEFLKREFLRSLSGCVHLKSHDPQQALIEAVIARGDRHVACLIEKAWEGGARFDQWGELFDFSLWQKTFDETGISSFFYAGRERPENEIFPWSHIRMGVEEEFLKEEYQRALQGVQTQDCREGGCNGCGACTEDMQQKVERLWLYLSPQKEQENVEQIPFSAKPDLKLGEAQMRVRITFSKTGDAVFLSHLDLIRTFTLAARRVKLPLAYTRGFHPNPCISFGPALPVGMEGIAEYVDLELVEMMEIDQILKELNSALPKGITPYKAEVIPIHSKSLNATIREAHYQVIIPKECLNGFNTHTMLTPGTVSGHITECLSLNGFRTLDSHLKRVQEVMSKDTITCYREGKKGIKEINIRPLIREIKIEEKPEAIKLMLKMTLTPEQNARPVEVAEALYGPIIREWNGKMRIARTGLFLSATEGVL